MSKDIHVLHCEPIAIFTKLYSMFSSSAASPPFNLVFSRMKSVCLTMPQFQATPRPFNGNFC